MELIVLMAAATLLIMLLSFFSLTREDRDINREYLDLLAQEAAVREQPVASPAPRLGRQHAHG
ncbi:hypothetical protein [Deinococcus aerophilus]|uniref:Uncharacterized protein n=1 Tax=Deinococcus aerophilus TaxID=522488 RepID=A0ABQ2GWW1_9DEIO|nr:hypothetical protein [Deinococcus aerophilus]GGM15750.1 hypothetical protein GCM10010841_25170 [Deinococcus aerophilus]